MTEGGARELKRAYIRRGVESKRDQIRVQQFNQFRARATWIFATRIKFMENGFVISKHNLISSIYLFRLFEEHGDETVLFFVAFIDIQ